MDDAGRIDIPPRRLARLVEGAAYQGAMAMMARRESAALEDEDPSAWIADIAVSKDRESYARLFLRFAPRVKSYLLKLGVPPEQAEELAQETLLTVWRKASYFDPERAAASTWIFTIARNLRIDAGRRERGPEALENEPELMPAAAPAVEDACSAAERETRVRRAIAALSDEQAQVVRLSFFQDKPHSEISEDLGLPLGTVKSRLRLALARLRSQLEADLL
jgi:RNA polymerase sigma-70 factor (ECF subfamily)